MSALLLPSSSALTLSLSQVRRTSRTIGADLLDRVELMLAIEAQFAGVEITDDDVEQIQLVGDLIRHLNIKLRR
jgi:acyl carrier protein